MYIEGVYDALRVQDSEDLTGEIAELIDDILYDLYRTGATHALRGEAVRVEQEQAGG